MAQLWDAAQHCRMNEPLDTFSPSPEAISLSDKLDKSDEKMDTSETSGSSEKMSPLPNDYEAGQGSTTTPYSAVTAATATTLTSTRVTNANLSKQTTATSDTSETTPTPHPRTDSTASLSSLQAEEVDLDLPSNYQTETVDFPDSPRQLKIMNQSSKDVQASLVDDVVPEEEDEVTEQPDDEAYRAVLSPTGDGTKLKKVVYPSPEVFRTVKASRDSSESSKPSAGSNSPWLTRIGTMESIIDDGIRPLEEEEEEVIQDSSFDDVANPVFLLPDAMELTGEQRSNTSQSSSSVSSSSSFQNSPAQKFAFTSTPMDANVYSDRRIGACGVIHMSPIEESGLSEASVERSLVEKILSCFYHPEEKIRDMHVLSERLRERLTSQEINEVLAKMDRYAVYLDDEVFEVLGDLVITMKVKSETAMTGQADKGGECACAGATTGCEEPTMKRNKISVNRDQLDHSIAEHFDQELQISAVFERTKSIRRSSNKNPAHPRPNAINADGLRNSSQPVAAAAISAGGNLTYLEVSCGKSEAIFQESTGDVVGIADGSLRKKLRAPTALLNWNLEATSPESSSPSTILTSSASADSSYIVALPCVMSERALTHDLEEPDDSSTSRTSSDPRIAELQPSTPNHVTTAEAGAAAISFDVGVSPDLDRWSISPPDRPNTLNALGKKKRKIKVNPDILNASDDQDDKSLSSISNRSEGDILSPIDDIATPDDIETPDELEDSAFSPASEPIPEVSAAEERDDERRWRTCVIGGVQRKIDMKVIEPYKKVLSHGGYYGPKRSAIIVFSACYLPDRGRKDYDYVMDNLFLYVLTTLDQLVAEDYLLVYLHGAMDRNNMPTFGWLKRCYQMIDRRLRKNLKGLYLVHPTFWLRAIVAMTRPFISAKFSRKLQFVNSLQELAEMVPVDQMSIPDRVKQFEFARMIREKKKRKKSAPY